MKAHYTDEEFKNIKAEILPRDEAEYEFNTKFKQTRPNQQIAEVKLYYRHSFQGWTLIRESDMEKI